MIQFVNYLVDDLSVSPKVQHCALITFGENATLHSVFNDANYHTAEGFKALVNQSIPKELPKNVKWGTRTDLAYNLALKELFTPDGGDRPNAPNVMIVFTDGEWLVGNWDKRPMIPFKLTTSALEVSGSKKSVILF